MQSYSYGLISEHSVSSYLSDSVGSLNDDITALKETMAQIIRQMDKNKEKERPETPKVPDNPDTPDLKRRKKTPRKNIGRNREKKRLVFIVDTNQTDAHIVTDFISFLSDGGYLIGDYSLRNGSKALVASDMGFEFKRNVCFFHSAGDSLYPTIICADIRTNLEYLSLGIVSTPNSLRLIKSEIDDYPFSL